MIEQRPEAAHSAGDAAAFHNLAVVLEHGGELEDAEGCLRAAIALRERAGRAHEADILESRMLLARVLARRGGDRAGEAAAELERVRPFIAEGSAFDGAARWTEALIAHASGADHARVEQLLEQAAERMRGDAVWSTWLAEDRRRLAGRAVA